eukprot:3955389-Pyramimonas_sp.AAC.1
MAGAEDTIDRCAKFVEDDGDCNVTLDQDEYIKQTRPIQHSEFTGADADAKASNMVTHMFVSLRGALAYALIIGVVDGLCRFPTACPSTDRHAGATTERGYQEA